MGFRCHSLQPPLGSPIIAMVMSSLRGQLHAPTTEDPLWSGPRVTPGAGGSHRGHSHPTQPHLSLWSAAPIQKHFHFFHFKNHLECKLLIAKASISKTSILNKDTGSRMTQLLAKQPEEESGCPHPQRSLFQEALGNLDDGPLGSPCLPLPAP